MPRPYRFPGCSPFRVIHSQQAHELLQHIIAVKVDFQRALAVLVVNMDLAAGDLLQRGLHLDGALGAGEVILDLGRLGGLCQLFAQGLGLAHIQILRRDLRR